MRQTYISEPGERPEPINVVSEAINILIGGDQDKPFEVQLQSDVRDAGPADHSHPQGEAFYVLDGEVEVTLEGQARVLATGGFVQIPANTIHAYKKLSERATNFGRPL